MQPLMKTASTNAPASKRLSLHSLPPPRQSLPTWLPVDHAFSSFFFETKFFLFSLSRLPVSRLETLMSRSRRQVTDWRRRRALRRTRDTGSGASSLFFHPPLHYKCIQRILGIAFLFRPLHYVVHCLRAFEGVSG